MTRTRTLAALAALGLSLVAGQALADAPPRRDDGQRQTQPGRGEGKAEGRDTHRHHRAGKHHRKHAAKKFLKHRRHHRRHAGGAGQGGNGPQALRERGRGMERGGGGGRERPMRDRAE